MRPPYTPAPSPALDEGPRQTLPPMGGSSAGMNTSWTLQGANGPRDGNAMTPAEVGALVRAQGHLASHPDLLRLPASTGEPGPPPPIPTATGTLGQPGSQVASPAPNGVGLLLQAQPPSQHQDLPLAQYTQDLEAAQPTEDARSYTRMTALPFMPSISCYRGPLHACIATHTRETNPPHHADMPPHNAPVQHSVLVCELCLAVFHYKVSAIAHSHAHGAPSLFHCGCCRSSFTTSAARESHWLQYRGCWEQHEIRVKSTAANVIEDWHEYLATSPRTHAHSS